MTFKLDNLTIDFFRYSIVGFVATLLNFTIYVLFYQLNLSVFFCSFFGYVIGMLISYHYGRTWVFGKKFSASLKSSFKFLLVYGVGGFGMSGIVFLFHNYFVLEYRLCWFLGFIFSIINNFLGMKYIVFRHRE